MKEYIQTSNTLRLLLMYSQFKDVEDVIFAFNVLQDKDYEKSVYITKAIHYYDETITDSIEMTEALFPIRCMSFIRTFYGVKTKKDVKHLLELGTDSDTFKNAEKRMLKHETPRESLLGFNKHDPDAKAMHARLFQLEVRQRIMLIAVAIKKYVMDGMDSAALMACSHKLVHDFIIAYEKAENKDLIVQTFYEMLKQYNVLT